MQLSDGPPQGRMPELEMSHDGSESLDPEMFQCILHNSTKFRISFFTIVSSLPLGVFRSHCGEHAELDYPLP